MATKPRHFNRAEIIRRAAVESIDKGAHLLALIKHEQDSRHPSAHWIHALGVSSKCAWYRGQKALRLDIRRCFSPEDRRRRDALNPAWSNGDAINATWSPESAR